MSDSLIIARARILRRQVLVGAAILVMFYLAARFGLRLGPIVLQSRSLASGGAQLPIVGDGAMLLFVVAVFWLTQALRAITSGGLFAALVVSRFRRFAVWLLLMALFGFVAPAVLDVAKQPAAGQHRVTLLLDMPNLLLVGITYVLFLITSLFDRARAIEAEMQEIL